MYGGQKTKKANGDRQPTGESGGAEEMSLLEGVVVIGDYWFGNAIWN